MGAMYGIPQVNDEPSRAAEVTRPHPAMTVSAELPPPPGPVVRGGPIGSLPAASEAPPKQRVSDVFEEAQRYLAMIRDGTRDIAAASWRLARLPWEVAMVAAKQLRPLSA